MESFSKEGTGHAVPRREDITPDDCTLALVAAVVTENDPSLIQELVINENPVAVTLGCKACFAELQLTGFANVQGSEACASPFRSEANQIIIDSTQS